jgi:hypothetical protein
VVPGRPRPVDHAPVAGPQDGSPPPAKRPTLVAGILVGVAAAVVGVILVVVTIVSAMNSMAGPPNVWVMIVVYFWPFIVLIVAGVLLMISRKWRRFGTGFLIVMAATAIIVLGPCIGLLVGF